MYSPPLSRSMLGDFLESFQRDSPTVGKNSSPEKKKQNTRWRSKVISSRAAERMELLGAELCPTLRSGWARSVKTLVLVLKCLRNWLKKLVLP